MMPWNSTTILTADSTTIPRPTAPASRTASLPLTGFTYGELDTGSFAKLTPCPYCSPVQRKAEIDEENRAMGLTTPQSTSQQASASAEEEEAQAVPAMADMDETEVHIQIKDGP